MVARIPIDGGDGTIRVDLGRYLRAGPKTIANYTDTLRIDTVSHSTQTREQLKSLDLESTATSSIN